MKKIGLKTVFFGSQEFGVPTIKVLFEKTDLLAVIALPDKRAGRGLKPLPQPTKVFAKEIGVDIIETDDPNKDYFLDTLAELSPDLIVVCGFGKKFSKDLLSLPKCGCINLHPSLLPKYRGPAPIERAIMNGEEKTGVSWILMNEMIDGGDILAKSEIEIDENILGGELKKVLSKLGAELLVELLPKIAKKSIKTTPQDEKMASYAPPIKDRDRKIDWAKSARDIHNQIRALSPKPCAYTYLKGKRINILESRIESLSDGSFCPGEIISTKGKLLVSCGSGILSLIRLQREGKKVLFAKDFVLGANIKTKEFFHDRKN